MDEIGRKLLIVGDVFFSHSDIDVFFNKLKFDLKDYVVLANLEGSINFGSRSQARKAVRLALPRFEKEHIPENLMFAMVNNHVTDFGISNFNKNIEYFGPKVVVSTRDKIFSKVSGEKIVLLADEKEQCILDETNFIGFTNKQVDAIGKDLAASIVVVHGGIEHRKYPTNYQRALARKIIDYGAKAVIFHHSHMIGYYEYWNGNLIHYGLGNAFFSNTLDLHSLKDSISHGVLCNEGTRIFKLAELGVVDENFIKREPKVDQIDSSEYGEFYKKLYRLDGSFRPRQLALSDFYNSVQFFIWSKIANIFVTMRLSKKIKIVLNFLFGKK